jgi:succinate dehydrogenase / fumarate reductase iron-sulfur subunit
MESMTLNLRVWRQGRGADSGHLVEYTARNVSPDMSFLELLDVLNDEIIKGDGDPIAYDSDCREGICGSCGMVISGVAHGPKSATTACQLFMRHFKDGDTITVEPWRAKAFPIIKDLAVDRSAFDRIQAAGGYISVDAGGAVDANEMLIGKEDADRAMDAAACIGCGACVAACKNASAELFVGAKITQLSLLPQGQPERDRRVLAMVAQMEKEGFGPCSNEGECEAVCPKEISVAHIQTLHREFSRASLRRIFRAG